MRFTSIRSVYWREVVCQQDEVRAIAAFETAVKGGFVRDGAPDQWSGMVATATSKHTSLIRGTSSPRAPFLVDVRRQDGEVGIPAAAAEHHACGHEQKIDGCRRRSKFAMCGVALPQPEQRY